MLIQNFTGALPECPKCGGKKIERRYAENWLYKHISEPVLICNCQNCGYKWPQHTKDYKEK
jgi:uncharacterized Zn finger protein